MTAPETYASTSPTPFKRLASFWSNPWWLLAGAILAFFIGEFRWGIGIVSLLGTLFLLRYIRINNHRSVYFMPYLALLIGYSLAVVKISTQPGMIFMAPLFGFPIALVHAVPLLLLTVLRNKISPLASTLLFAASATILQWLLYTVTPFSSWGITPHLFLGHHALLQSLSIFGMPGLTFFILWGVALIEVLFSIVKLEKFSSHSSVPIITSLLALMSLLIIFMVWGHIRMDSQDETDMGMAGVIRTDWHVSQGFLSHEEQQQHWQIVFERTQESIDAGAEIVVWNEAATMVDPDREQILLNQASHLAKTNKIMLIIAYAVLESMEPLRFQNKYQWISPTGTIEHEYLKRHPVPGEPAIPGTSIPEPVQTRFGKASGAICYDVDFPKEGLYRSADEISLLVVPSSDWKGINRIHTQMASLRAIENGFSMIRSTNRGLSATIDPYGRIIGQLDYFASNQKWANLAFPIAHVSTTYAVVGDLFVFFCIALAIGLIVFSLLSQRTKENAP